MAGGGNEFASTPQRLVLFAAEDSPRGLGRTLGKRVGGNPSRVRISYPPPLSERPIDQCFRWSERSTALAGAEQWKGRSRDATGPSSVSVSTPVSTGHSGEHFHPAIAL